MNKKIFLAATAILLIAAACNKTTDQPSQQPADNNQNQNPQTVLQTYRNSTYGFKFQYPDTMSFVTPRYANLQDKVVELQIPQADYPKTNFGDAAFSVSESFAKSLADCLKLNPPENGDGFKTKFNINGVDFYGTLAQGVGAGNIYESVVSRTLVGNQTCIELNETIHTGNIANYPEGTVTEVDHNAVQKRLDDVLQTFQFTSQP